MPACRELGSIECVNSATECEIGGRFGLELTRVMISMKRQKAKKIPKSMLTVDG